MLTRYASFYINPDLTKEQCKQDFLLRQQHREMRTVNSQNRYKNHRGRVTHYEAETSAQIPIKTLKIDYQTIHPLQKKQLGLKFWNVHGAMKTLAYTGSDLDTNSDNVKLAETKPLKHFEGF